MTQLWQKMKMDGGMLELMGKLILIMKRVVQNKNGWWYLKNGKVDFDKKMIFTDPKTGFIYNVINGKRNNYQTKR